MLDPTSETASSHLVGDHTKKNSVEKGKKSDLYSCNINKQLLQSFQPKKPLQILDNSKMARSRNYSRSQTYSPTQFSLPNSHIDCLP